jgi:hypothetical protein
MELVENTRGPEDSGLQAHPPLCLLFSLYFVFSHSLVCPRCARYLRSFASFHDAPRPLAQLSDERCIVPFDGLDRIPQELRDVIGRSATREQINGQNCPESGAGVHPETPALRPKVSILRYRWGSAGDLERPRRRAPLARGRLGGRGERCVCTAARRKTADARNGSGRNRTSLSFERC